MAVIKAPQKASLMITVLKDNKSKKLSYSGVKPDAGDQAVYDCGNALAGLQSNSLVAIGRQDDANIISG